MVVRRGEIYFVELGPTLGREQAGRRPVVVVSNDAINSKPLVIMVVPGTRDEGASKLALERVRSKR
jgi:mRNA interferase MazF